MREKAASEWAEQSWVGFTQDHDIELGPALVIILRVQMQAPRSFTAIWWRCKKAASAILDFSALGLACAQYISRVYYTGGGSLETHSREPTVSMEIQYSWALTTSSLAFPGGFLLWEMVNATALWHGQGAQECVWERGKKRERGRCWIDRCFPQMGNHTRCLFLWREWKLHARRLTLSRSLIPYEENPSHAKQTQITGVCVCLTVDGK